MALLLMSASLNKPLAIILLEDFMKPMGISARRLAADIDVSPSRISELVNGHRPVTADTALRLGLLFGM
jgi:antitoxin HigA-1